MANRPDVPRQNTHEIRVTVKGFMTPEYVDKDVYGRMLNAFSRIEDVRRIQNGYACGNCCAIFDSFQLECPICHLATNVSGQMQDAPADWQQFYDEHNNGAGATQTRSPDEFLRAVSQDTDVDQIPIEKLKPSRHGLGAPK